MAELERPTIQLADASGPQPLSDESNYKFLQQIFDAKERDPLAKAGYDVDAVFQILEGKKGYSAYGAYGSDLAQQPDIIPNPMGTSINHAIAFFYLTALGLITYLKEKNYSKTLFLLLSLSILLEISHFIIPNRSFQLLDLFANLLGTLLAIVIIFFYKRLKNGKI